MDGDVGIALVGSLYVHFFGQQKHPIKDTKHQLGSLNVQITKPKIDSGSTWHIMNALQIRITCDPPFFLRLFCSGKMEHDFSFFYRLKRLFNSDSLQH